MNPLCTVLPDLPPSGWAERYLFSSAILSDWCHEHDLADMHATFLEAGIPYTVQFVPPAVKADDSNWSEELRSPESRNSFARLQ